MEQIEITANDGFPLAATLFRPAGETRAALVVNSAMAVRREFYAAFAQASAQRGFATITYDYRGIGGSRPVSLRGFAARAVQWMTLDCEAVLAWRQRELDAPCTFVVGHSFGGNAFGLAPSSREIDAAVFVAAQSGYWKLWPAPRRQVLGLLWHTLAPIAPRLFGYMPGWAGMGNDVPRDVMLQWAGWVRSRRYAVDDASIDVSGYGRLNAPLRLLSFADDVDYAPRSAVEALLQLYPAAASELLHVEPRTHGLGRVGHFGFFNARNRALWPLAFDWLLEHCAVRDRIAA